MQVRILGCGPSYGVPSLCRGFGTCDPTNPKNIRSRSSILVRADGTNILIDAGPDIRWQLLQAGRPDISGVLYTHEHYDHMGGADDLRSDGNSEILPIYLTQTAFERFQQILPYMFQPDSERSPFAVNIIEPYKTFHVKDVPILPIPQKHGKDQSIGYRIGDFAYSTDVVQMEDQAFDALKGIKTWILGVVTPIKNNKHVTVKTALEWIERVHPERVYFTHMGCRMDYERLCRYLPPHVRPAYDGMELDI